MDWRFWKRKENKVKSVWIRVSSENFSTSIAQRFHTKEEAEKFLNKKLGKIEKLDNEKNDGVNYYRAISDIHNWNYGRGTVYIVREEKERK